MNLARLIRKLFPRTHARAMAKEAASRACHTLLPGEPILGATICADEPGRYVVRVFCGNRPASPEVYRLPPWRECLIFAVMKDTYSAEQIRADEKYRPMIR